MTKKDLRERDTFMWMTCNNKQNHEVEKLMLTQIVAGDSMNIVFSNLHQISLQWNIELECGCPDHPFSESLQVNILSIFLGIKLQRFYDNLLLKKVSIKYEHNMFGKMVVLGAQKFLCVRAIFTKCVQVGT